MAPRITLIKNIVCFICLLQQQKVNKISVDLPPTLSPNNNTTTTIDQQQGEYFNKK
jgi:hypothetical protein